jgi:hypothetical protein
MIAVDIRKKVPMIKETLNDLINEIIESTYANARFQLPNLYIRKGIFQIKIIRG